MNGPNNSTSLTFGLALAVLLLLSSACGSPSGSSSNLEGRRETIDGVLHVRHEGLNAGTPTLLNPSVMIGTVDGDEATIFGEIKGVDVDREGNIYVLDAQPREIRVFDPSGTYLRTLGGQGSGPGEIERANGFMILPDNSVWIQDHGQWKTKVFDVTGNEVALHPVPIRSWAYVWSGFVTNERTILKRGSLSDEPPSFPPKAGLNESSGQGFLVSYDTQTAKTDTTWLGRYSGRSFVVAGDRGFSHMGIPFGPSAAWAYDPEGGFVKAAPYEHAFARMDAQADTVLIVKTDLDGSPVTQQDKDSYVDAVADRGEPYLLAAQEIVKLMPATKPSLQALSVDDKGRIWAMRQTDAFANPVFDVFSNDGNYLNAFELDHPVAPWFPVRVKGNKLYALAGRADQLPQVLVFDVPW